MRAGKKFLGRLMQWRKDRGMGSINHHLDFRMWRDVMEGLRAKANPTKSLYHPSIDDVFSENGAETMNQSSTGHLPTVRCY